MKNIKKYYWENANRFGWGPKTARLDPKRITLLNKYVGTNDDNVRTVIN